MGKTDSLSLPMIMGDWKLIILALQEKLNANTAIDMDDVDDDEAAALCEEMDKLEGLLNYLTEQFTREYGDINLPG
ncbi:hypothetical protein [Pantoea sp. BAV 3049]|uniref:hypothetical protein n=1 Tax=Pantoea sp. BAV 3049 TaxID=2654188 RepID=UPI00131D0604|nr:hypothetical protein [Pantoea sp. BAV 3049]